MRSVLRLSFLIIFYSSLYSQTASLERTLTLKKINGISVPFQNGTPLPSFEKQKRTIHDLSGVWKKMRFSADHNLTLSSRSGEGLTNLLNENPDYQLSNFDDSGWETINIPSVENVMNEFPTVPEYYEDGVWYRYKFTIDDSLSESFAKLMFYSVNYVADVWLNDVYIGYHEGGYTPFSFNISDQINYAHENVIAVRVDNPPWGSRKDIVPFYRCDWFNYTGIIHDIYIEFSSKVSIIRADIIPKNIDGEILTNITIYNSDNAEKNISAKIEIFETEINENNIKNESSHELISGEASFSGTTNFNLSVDSNSVNVISEKLFISDPQLWSFLNPNLYVMKISLFDGEQLIDEYHTQFGIRTILRNENKILLNNNVSFLTGAARHEDHPVFGRSIPKDIIFNDINYIDTSNINYLRTSHYPNNPYTYLITDRLGIGVMEEIPVWWFDNEEEWLIQNNERHIHEQMFREMVFKDFNRPSILFWSTSNECKEETNRLIYNNHIVDDLRNNYNDGRLITQSSAGDNPGSGDITQEPLDIAGWTLYFGIFHGSTYYNGTLIFLSQASSLHPNKPIIDTEFGYWSSEDNSNYERQVTVFNETFKAFEFFSPLKKDGTLNSNGFLAGTTWWCVFDWYSHQHKNGFQSMGLISMDRLTEKPVYQQLKSSYEPYYSLGGMVITELESNNSDSKIDNFRINQNYPNPFNPSTVVSYLVPEKSDIKITLYNSLGQKEKSLINSVKEKGNYEYRINGTDLSSGVYFCEMRAKSLRSNEEFRSTIKLLLIK